MKIEISKTDNGLEVLGLVVPQEALEITGFGSMSSINERIDTGEIRCVWISKGYAGERRLIIRKDCEKVSQIRLKKLKKSKRKLALRQKVN